MLTTLPKLPAMYEHKRQPLASRQKFVSRLTKSFLFTLFILLICLTIGVLGYHYTAKIPWLDSLHNASMILSGMGPVVTIDTVAGKWFSSFYALFSGVAFITNIGLLLAPVVHRFFHRLHLEEQ
jgi:type II secretory pathway component PulF